MRILINAGHGGKDCGAIGQTGLKEAHVNLNVAKLVQKYLTHRNINSIVLQQTNSLNEVIDFTNKGLFDIGISIHCNASENKTANGVEVLYYPTSKCGKEMAKCVQDELVKKTGLRDRGIKERRDLGFLRKTKCPCILVECAFISNREEEQMLKNDYSLFAQGIVRGLDKWLA